MEIIKERIKEMKEKQKMIYEKRNENEKEKEEARKEIANKKNEKNIIRKYSNKIFSEE